MNEVDAERDRATEEEEAVMWRMLYRRVITGQEGLEFRVSGLGLQT